jgi:uncharacterized protein
VSQLLRLLIIFAALWLAVQLVRRALRSDQSSASHNNTSPNPPRMLPCAYCGVHVPESEAITRAGKIYCCREHGAQEEAKR